MSAPLSLDAARRDAAVGEVATLRHGYSMADVTRLAKQAASAVSWRGADYEDQFEAAWFGVVEGIYGLEEPDESDLRLAGMKAVRRLHNEIRNTHGLDAANDWQPSRSFQKFWREASAHVESPEDSLCERLALPQVLAVLTGEQYEALAAAAVHPTLRSAADAIGLTYANFQNRYYAARKIIRRHWLAPDTPRDGRPTVDSCGSGHAKAEYERTAPDGHAYCRRCETLALRRRRAKGSR